LGESIFSFLPCNSKFSFKNETQMNLF